ncbi:MAG: trehalose-phosphatase [Candidatus Omnitrophota bacterium]
MKCVGPSWSTIERKIRSHEIKFLILDFDGTLAAIAKTPQAVVLKRKTKESLARLSRSTFYKVAIVSGRSLKSLLAYFNLRNVLYVGNHGLEMKGKGLPLPARARKARKLEALIWLLGEKLKEALAKVPGAFIEDKNYTLSLHYRNIPREHLPFFKQEIDVFRKKYAHWPLLWKPGKKTWEVRPSVRWGKGEVALYLTKKFPGALPIVIGDDLTDEDMFRVLRAKGITIRVGLSKKSNAEYYLASQRQVKPLLDKLCP